MMMAARFIDYMRVLAVAGGVGVIGLLAVPRAGAQNVSPADDGKWEKQTSDIEMCFLKGATIQGGAGKVEESSLDATWNWSFLSLEYLGKSYNWESSPVNPFSPGHEPVWNTLNTVWLTVSYSNSITASWQYSVDADVFVSFEREHFGLFGNDEDSVLFRALPGGWSVFGGISVHHSPFQTDVYPLLGIMQRDESDPGWTIKAGIPETKIEYRFTPRTSLDAGFSIFNVDYYLLAVDSDEEHDRYLETSDNRLFLVLNLKPRKNIQVGLGIQYTVDNQLMFYSANQQNRTSYPLSSVPGFLLKMQYCF